MSMVSSCALLLLTIFCADSVAIANCPPPPLPPQFAIDYSYPPYNQLPNIEDNPGLSGEGYSERAAAMSNAIRVYHLAHGLESAPPGTAFMITYQDGASEEGQVQILTSDLQALPVPGSFESAEELAQCAAKYSDGGGLAGKGGSGVNSTGPSGGGATWINICDDYYSDGEYQGTRCHVENE